MKPILCVDWDGVIHSYTSGWQGADIISDPPVPGAIQRLWSCMKANWDVQIYSSRTRQEGGCEAMERKLRVWAQDEFDVAETAEEFMDHISFPRDKPAATLTIDDRCLTFDGDFSHFDPEVMLKFKPWNKK